MRTDVQTRKVLIGGGLIKIKNCGFEMEFDFLRGVFDGEFGGTVSIQLAHFLGPSGGTSFNMDLSCATLTLGYKEQWNQSPFWWVPLFKSQLGFLSK